MAKSIQFRGIDDTVDAFEKTKAKGWAICDGKQFLLKGTGCEWLEEMLKQLETSSTNTIYTLRIYDNATDPKDIREKTEYDSSFNFVFDKETDIEELTTGRMYASTNRRNRLFDRLGLLEQKVDSLLSEPEAESEEEKPITMGSIMADIYKNPRQLIEWANVFNVISGRSIHYPMPAAIGSIGEKQNAIEIPPEEKQVRAQIAVNILEQNDPNLIIHLEKLAKLATQNPQQFKFLTNLLDNM